ncbi:MAG: hypothetical protein ACRECU_13985 [Methylocella sp.]
MVSAAQWIYSRTISIRRPNAIASPGSSAVSVLVDAYSGLTAADETAIYTGLPASVQWQAESGRPTPPLPGDTVRSGGWNIYLPKSVNIAPGAINENDIIVDDAGRRYQIDAAYPHNLGWKLRCRFLKA